MRGQFEQFTLDYFTRRPSLAMVFLLVDASIRPQLIDLDYACWLSNHSIPFGIVFTKTDKRKKREPGYVDNISAFKRAMLRGSVEDEPAAAAAATTGEQILAASKRKATAGSAKVSQKVMVGGAAAAAVALTPSAVSTSAPKMSGEDARRKGAAAQGVEGIQVGFAALPPSVATSAEDGTGKSQLLHLIGGLRMVMEQSGRLKAGRGLQVGRVL